MAWPTAAQVRTGELSSRLSGTIAPTYSATYGNMTGSTHAWLLGGTANYSGFFHSPNFLSLDAGFYLNQSRANSNFQSISNASGFNLTSNIFAGSHFPGSVTYTKAYNSEGNYSIPGLADYVTHGNSDTFGINWSETLPDVPSFSAGYQMGSSRYSVYGTNDQGTNAFRSLNLHSAYRLAGFSLGAYFSDGTGNSEIPQIVAGEITSIRSDNSSYGLTATHMLPLKGSFSAGINRSNWNSGLAEARSTGTIDTVNAVAAIHPYERLSASVSLNYSDNLSGQIYQSVIASGGVIPGFTTDQTSNSFDAMGVTTYTVSPGFQTSGFVERRTQSFEGESYGVNSYGASVAFAHDLARGTFNSAFTVTENTTDNTGENTVGFSSTSNYSTLLAGWHLNGSFGYAQNVQTLLVTYMNSYYNYSGNVRRNWGRFNIGAGAAAAHTALTQQAGTVNASQSYNASAGFGGILTATGMYSKSDGQALATGAGLIPVPVPPPVLPSGVLSLFGGESYAFSLSSSPAKRLVLAAAYARSKSNTSTETLSSENQNNQFNALVQYRFRKMSFNGGFARLEQGFSASGTQPQVISNYAIGVSRWFNFF